MSEIVGRHLNIKEASDSAERMAEFWNEEYRVYFIGESVFVVERGWPKRTIEPSHIARPKGFPEVHP